MNKSLLRNLLPYLLPWSFTRARPSLPLVSSSPTCSRVMAMGPGHSSEKGQGKGHVFMTESEQAIKTKTKTDYLARTLDEGMSSAASDPRDNGLG